MPWFTSISDLCNPQFGSDSVYTRDLGVKYAVLYKQLTGEPEDLRTLVMEMIEMLDEDPEERYWEQESWLWRARKALGQKEAR